MKRSALAVAALVWVSYAAPLRATHPQSARNPLAIWSHLPPPPLMKGIGNATLKITTTSPAAQAYFDQGLELLDDFWFFEAYRAFSECARLDPSAAMAYWGMARALANYPTMQNAEKEVIAKAEGLMGNVSPHERSYIRAAADLAGRKDEGYVHKMQLIIKEYPGDLNAPAELAFFVMSGFDPDGRPTPGQLYAEALLRRILATQPDNVAANHFWIHAVEAGADPQDGLKSALLIAKLAPNSDHLVHMAGHLYFRLGDYETARQAFLRSMRVGGAYLEAEHVPAQDDSNFEHNLSYLVADCAEEGRFNEALRWAEKLRQLPASPVWGASALNYAVPVGSTLLKLHLRYGDWQAAARDSTNDGVPAWQVDAPAEEYQEAWHEYARGMSALGKSPPSVQQAAQNSTALEILIGKLQAQQAAEPSIPAFWTGGAVRLLKIASSELQGRLYYAQGKNARARNSFARAVQEQRDLGYTEPPYYSRPVEETVGNVFLQMHDWQKARQAFRQELQLRPHSGFALFGIAESYAQQGQVSQAAQAFRAFLVAWRHADLSLARVRAAKVWVATHPETTTRVQAQREAGNETLAHTTTQTPAVSKEQSGLRIVEPGRFPPLVQKLEEAAESDPSSWKRALAFAEALLTSNYNFSGLQFLLSVKPRFDNRLEYRYILGLAYDFCYKYSEAIKEFQTFPQDDPHFNRIPYLIGNCYLYRGNLKEAIVYFRKAIALDPQEADYQVALANMLRMEGRLAQAIPVLDKALSLKPDDPYISLHLAECEMGQHDFTEAQVILERLVSERPQFQPARLALANVYDHRHDWTKARRQRQIAARLQPPKQYRNPLLGPVASTIAPQ
jgi:tetratricopeptide (TPR) repeat protein